MGSPAPSAPVSGRAPRAGTAAPPRTAAWFPLVLALGLALAVALVVVLPYEVGGYQQGEVGRVSPVLRWCAFLLVLLGPIAAMGVGLCASTWACVSWRWLRRRDTAFLLLAVVVAVATVVFLVTPVGQESTDFWLD